MLSRFFACMIFWFSANALAEDNKQLDDTQAGLNHRSQCFLYDHNPASCMQTFDCEYDYRWNTCEQAVPGGSGYCRNYDNDQYHCNQQPDCQFDYRTGICNDGDQGGGGGWGYCRNYDRDQFRCNQQPDCHFDPRTRTCEESAGPVPPASCSQHNRYPDLCDQTFGCRWDSWTRRCVDDQGGGNGGSESLTIRCGSYDNRRTVCLIGGYVQSAQLVRQISGARCSQGTTWGSVNDGIWVDYGCVGDFRVSYYRQ